MTADITFHYPPELFNLLVDTIPVLNRSKKDVLLFFRGAGVSGDLVDDIAKRLKSAPSELNKYEMVRTILDGLNTRG
jgi:restriction system protein